MLGFPILLYSKDRATFSLDYELVCDGMFDRMDTNKSKTYCGACKDNFRKRYNHKAKGKDKGKIKVKKDVQVSPNISIWELKDINTNYDLKWSMPTHAQVVAEKMTYV